MVGVKKKVTDVAPPAAKESSVSQERDSSAGEAELRRMAWFAMWHSGQRMRRLAGQARSAELQAQLSWMIAQLDKHATHLQKGGPRNTGDDGPVNARTPGTRISARRPKRT